MPCTKTSISLLLSAILFFCAVPVYPQSTESMMSQGNMLLENGAFDQAVTAYRKVLARDPQNFEAQFNLAFAYLNWGRFSNAVTEFNKAVGLNPNSADAWSNLAMAYENQGKSQKAIDALYRAVQTNPNNIVARINLATMYGQKKQLGAAIAQYKQVLQIDGTNLDATVNLAKCLVSQGNYKEAKHYLKSAIAINPNDPEAFWELGNLAWNSEKDAESAITNYQKAIVLKPNSQVYYQNLGQLLENLWIKNKDESKRKEAIAVWQKSLVYIDDALEKEEIQARLDRLERNESPAGKATPEELFGKSNMDNVEKVNRNAGKKPEDTKRINTSNVSMDDDISDLDSKQDTKSFDFDLDKAVDKKKKEKE